MKPRPPLIIPVFLPHLGCPHRCLFCDQRPLSGRPLTAAGPGAGEVAAEIRVWLARSSAQGRRVEVGFYGGSFTGLPLKEQGRLLAAVRPFLRAGRVDAIRLSTRPDYIFPETPAFLRAHGVETVELGVQSLHPETLRLSRRGHEAWHSEAAIANLKGAGLKVGAQLMLGLPVEGTVSTLAGCRRLSELGPDFVRLHPALVLTDSGLAALYRQGRYQPLPLVKAVALAARAVEILAVRGIPVIRAGLQTTPELEASLVAGPHHPAFGELVKTRVFFNQLRRRLAAFPQRPRQLTVAVRDRSLLLGRGREALRRLEALGLLDQTRIVFAETAGPPRLETIKDVDLAQR